MAEIVLENVTKVFGDGTRAVSSLDLEVADGEFMVTLAHSGVTLTVPPQKSILDVLIEAGIAVQYSCCDGVCGTCETRVLDGVPDHRDSVLLGEDANATDRIMVCVSRCSGASLTLDL